jgi:hypothetical protein
MLVARSQRNDCTVAKCSIGSSGESCFITIQFTDGARFGPHWRVYCFRDGQFNRDIIS